MRTAYSWFYYYAHTKVRNKTDLFFTAFYVVGKKLRCILVFILTGIGSGMVYLPAVVMVGQYFQKRRALAQGLSTTGTGFGAFLMTALLKYLCTEFGWRNAMFIQGAVSLNLCVCGALMRPLSPKDIVSEKHVLRSNSEDNQAKALPRSAETVKSNRVLKEEPEKKEAATNKEVLDNVQHTEIGGKSRSGRNIYGLCILKTVSQLMVRVRKGFAIWYSSYFGAASLFTNRIFVAFIIWALFAYSSFVIPFIHLPEIVKQYNLLTQNNMFPLTSIIAIVHIFGKVILGMISDLPCISTWNVFLTANFTLVTCILTLPLMQTYLSLAVVCALIGFSSGYFSLMPVVTEDLVGTKHLANAYGIIICANGVSALFGPPLAGKKFKLLTNRCFYNKHVTCIKLSYVMSMCSYQNYSFSSFTWHKCIDHIFWVQLTIHTLQVTILANNPKSSLSMYVSLKYYHALL